MVIYCENIACCFFKFEYIQAQFTELRNWVRFLLSSNFGVARLFVSRVSISDTI